MTCRPSQRGRVGLVGGIAAAVALVLAAPGAAGGSNADAALAKARGALARGDGIAAEIALKEAQSQGADRQRLAVGMGEAMLLQGRRDKAREWLGPGQFAAGDAVQGLRVLARLDMAEGKLADAAGVLDKALTLDGGNADVWIDIAQLRYRMGNQADGIAAADRALAADPGSVRGLGFRALAIREQFGPEPALQWFEAALLKAPNDGVILGDFAATLGELGRYRQMLAVTRKMLDLGVAEPRAHYLQAVLAARAGNMSLARAKLNRLGKGIAAMPSALLLSGVIDLQSGNANLAIESFRRLVEIQPQNEVAQELLARSLYEAGQQKQVIERFAARAGHPSASPYLLTLVARAYEDLGDRTAAAPLLDRAAAVGNGGLAPAFDIGAAKGGAADIAASRIRMALHGGAAPEGIGLAERLRGDWPGMASADALAGDAYFAAGNWPLAAERYAEAARVRSDGPLLIRMVLSATRAGQRELGAQMVAAYLSTHPQSPTAIRFAADYAASTGDWGKARLLLDNLRSGNGARDVRLLADLSYALLRLGDGAAAEKVAREALSLQPSSPVASQALALALKARKQEPELAEALSRRAARP
ncbi:tetratricopeptide repeat protein [Novosphingobium sp. TH158]|uniref:tetratricopeptide repeat protein n=1 Tax=Novosphingobium sp. TH158 TaxID=2067455 RepID=UPI00130446F1|nr:tetratricopeptide repeat protein [Novosphingobium sp. TH158]